MNCEHGLDGRFCAICNKATFTRDPFTGRKQENETPRFVKGRDKAEWAGVGERTEIGVGHHRGFLASSIAPPRSGWAETQTMRNLEELASHVRTLSPVFALSYVSIPAPLHAERPNRLPVSGRIEQLRWGDRIIEAVRESDMDERTKPKRESSPAKQRIHHARQKRNTRPAGNRG